MTTIEKLYYQLLKKHGPQRWWPHYSKNDRERKFEIAVGAILTQNTNWQNVEKAIANLRQEKLLSPKKIVTVQISKLKKLIKPSGYYNQKAKKLKIFSAVIVKEFQGDIDKLFQLPLKELREKLLSIWGIGFETADSIILYAAKKPIFVIDAYTYRLMKKSGWKKPFDYEELREYFESKLPKNVKLFQEFHALIVCEGKKINKKAI